ncbi:PAS domain-containing protein [Hymenobacter sp. DH14]|uniref:PAS domain-containing protein n=1 Tax=Hymenobacter cyanobacteriorum TaxID=2926463 RepID=A0A9X2AIH7_9BACT|nr:PAS domain-containing protein [Hymenobacter cyanobacteriorum]MCI1189983.1 PAS domain-containing protein [Hymenobacter cyanobacteriorum]
MPALSSDLISVFSALPSACLLLSPELVIEAASEAYLTTTATQRADVLGKYVFDVFPDNPDTPEAHSVHDVRASMERVLATGQPHELPVQPYDTPDPANPGQFVERYWQARNVPVLDEQGRVTHLIHTVVDITAQTQNAARVQDAQLREQAAREAAEWQRGELARIFEQAPVAIATYRGPNFVIELANPKVLELWDRTPAQAIGTPLFELLPEITGQGFDDLLNEVMTTGNPHVAKEMHSTIVRNGQPESVYWNFVYLPLREDDGTITGAMVVATEVSEQVQARQQIQVLNDQLAAVNRALHESNAELLTNQEEVLKVQQLLEGSVAERTRQLETALSDAEQHRSAVAQQQRLLSQILGQVPASIATLTGPEHRYSFFNEHYQQLSGGRTQLGLKVAEVFPEVVEQGFIDLLDKVYTTGVPFVGRDTPAQLYDPATGRPETRYVDFTYQPLLSDQNQTLGVLAFIVDVTEKVLAQHQAEALKAQLRGEMPGTAN